MPRGNPKPILPHTGGERRDLPFHLVPQGSLIDCENVISQNGELIIRSGYNPLLVAAPSASRVMGIYFYLHSNLTKKTVIGTKLGWYKLDGSAWTNITGNPLTGGDSDHVRFAIFQQGGTTYLIGVNDVNANKRWDGVVATYSDLGGSPPIARDIAVSQARVLLFHVTEGGIRSPSRIRISEYQNSESWPANLVMDLTETEGQIIGGKVLNRSTVAVYKDDSQWILIATGGSFPFRYELLDTAPGPVSPAAIVKWRGGHLYMARNGSFYYFDGISAKEIGQPIQPHILETLDFATMSRSHGVYIQRHNQIWWFYPQVFSAGPNLGVALDLDNMSWWPLKFGGSITASKDAENISTIGIDDLTGTIDGLDATYPTIDSMGGDVSPAEFLGQSTGQVHKLGFSTSDAGTPIDATWTEPLLPVEGSDMVTRIDQLDTFFKKTSTPITCEVTFGISNTLGQGPIFQSPHNIDISVDERHEIKEEDLEARFVCFKHRIVTAEGGVKWQGGYLFTNGKKIY